MKNAQKAIVWTIGMIVMAALATPWALAQKEMGQGMGKSQGMGWDMPRYDPSTVVTIEGTVQEVQEGMMRSGQMGQMHGMSHMGTHLLLRTEDATYTVLVGPTRFMREKSFQFAKDDQIEVTGSKVQYNGTQALIAREIKKGGKVLTLRNENGIPEWSMGRQR
jgi:hypothetical protein